jgi:hypothetical protein
MASNRRAFFKTLGLVAAGFSILPAATTYVRKWSPSTGWQIARFKSHLVDQQPIYDQAIINPEWINSDLEIHWLWSADFALELPNRTILVTC